MGFWQDGKGWAISAHGLTGQAPPVLLHALQEFKTFDLMNGVGIERCLALMVQNKPRMGETFRHQGAENDELFEAAYDHEGDETCEACNRDFIKQRPVRIDATPKVHYGNIASGNEVMKHGIT